MKLIHIKNILIVACLIIIASANISAQSFYVMHIKGKLFRQINGKEIAQGEVITSADKIRFSDNTASAVLINTKTGRYILKPVTGKSSSELNYVVSQVISPMNQTAGLNTRGGVSDSGGDVKEIDDYFGEGSFLFCDSINKISLNATKYPMDPSHYFVYSYKYHSENVNKKIGWDNNILLIEYKPLYTVKSEIIHTDSLPEVKLYYVNGSIEDSEIVASFHPIFKSREDMLVELGMAKKIYATDQSNTSAIRTQLKSYIRDVYGKSDSAVLENLLMEVMK